MKKLVNSLTIAALFVAVCISSCKKEEETPVVPDEPDYSTTGASDGAYVENSSNIAIDDANIAASAVGYLSGITTTSLTGLCGVTSIDSTQKASGILVLTYNGYTCDNLYTRTGTITITLSGATKWKDAGALITITFTNYMVTNNADNQTITLNGTHTLKNVNGGTLASLYATSVSLVHKVRAINMSITFNDGTVRTWSSARARTISYSTGIVTVDAAGDTTLAGVAYTEFWGTTRAGESFTTTLSLFRANSNCGFTAPVRGTQVHTIASKTVTVTYGVNVSGVQASGICANFYGYKISWTDPKGAAQTLIVGY